MAFRSFAQRYTKQILVGGAVGSAGLAASQLYPKGHENFSTTDAEIQFQTSFGFIDKGQQTVKAPKDWDGPLFKIRNDYPNMWQASTAGAGIVNSRENPILPGPDRPPPTVDPIEAAPWLKIDFEADPRGFCALIKEYCWEGNVNNGFVVQKNKIRDWYHAPWMHWNINGREPLNGFTFERATPPGELSKTQNRYLQNWACGYYNATG